jgi:hypothetical protein
LVPRSAGHSLLEDFSGHPSRFCVEPRDRYTQSAEAAPLRAETAVPLATPSHVVVRPTSTPLHGLVHSTACRAPLSCCLFGARLPTAGALRRRPLSRRLVCRQPIHSFASTEGDAAGSDDRDDPLGRSLPRLPSSPSSRHLLAAAARQQRPLLWGTVAGASTRARPPHPEHTPARQPAALRKRPLRRSSAAEVTACCGPPTAGCVVSQPVRRGPGCVQGAPPSDEVALGS